MRFLSTRGSAPAATFAQALFQGLAPDGGLFVPESIEPWSAVDLERLPRRTLTEIALRAMRPFVRGELDVAVLEAVVVEALNFDIPLVEVEPGMFALELFHGPTLAFKDVGARMMARLMAALHTADQPLTVLAATSGDTGSAVAHAFHRVPDTRVVVLYPHGRVSPTQEAQLTYFNDQRTNVRAYAVAGSFDDCHRLTREAFADAELRRQMALTSANSVNVGRLLPQTVYYFHALARNPDARMFSTPSGNFGNLTAGLMARRAGLKIDRFVAATNVNDVVPVYLASGRYEPRPSVQTLANAMDVGHPSNFERMSWMYGGSVDAMRRDITGARFTDDDVRATIRDVFARTGYLMDPHTAIAYAGLRQWRESGAGRDGQDGRDGQEGRQGQEGREGQEGQEGHKGREGRGDGDVGVFLATAHPAKFAEIVEPIIGCRVEKPAALADALARPRHIVRIDADYAAVKAILRS